MKRITHLKILQIEIQKKINNLALKIYLYFWDIFFIKIKSNYSLPEIPFSIHNYY